MKVVLLARDLCSACMLRCSNNALKSSRPRVSIETISCHRVAAAGSRHANVAVNGQSLKSVVNCSRDVLLSQIREAGGVQGHPLPLAITDLVDMRLLGSSSYQNA